MRVRMGGASATAAWDECNGW